MAILFAAMEDDTVLCEACLHDLHDDLVAQTPAMMLPARVHSQPRRTVLSLLRHPARQRHLTAAALHRRGRDT
jgi:hypothetical protein